MNANKKWPLGFQGGGANMHVQSKANYRSGQTPIKTSNGQLITLSPLQKLRQIKVN